MNIYLFVVALSCPVPQVENGVFTWPDTARLPVYTEQVTLNCNPGFVVAGTNKSDITVECGENRQLQDSQCIGEYLNNLGNFRNKC